MAAVAIKTASSAMELPLRPIKPNWVLDGNPVAHATELSRSNDTRSSVWVWQCEPGRFEWHYDTEEVIHLIEGKVLLDDGVSPPRRYGAGDIVFFPAGAVVRWTVEERVRKVAFFYRDLPRPVTWAVRLMRGTLGMVRRFTSGGSLVPATARAVTSL